MESRKTQEEEVKTRRTVRLHKPWNLRKRLLTIMNVIDNINSNPSVASPLRYRRFSLPAHWKLLVYRSLRCNPVSPLFPSLSSFHISCVYSVSVIKVEPSSNFSIIWHQFYVAFRWHTKRSDLY